MEARADFLHRPHLRLTVPDVLKSRLAAIGIASGVLGGIVLALPLLLWDWANGQHSALEYPMAVSAWLFGLNHFEQNGYVAWAIVVGALFLALYYALSGLAFAAIADRVYRVRTLLGSLALGALWSFFSWMTFWYMILPIAREGAPFKLTAAGLWVAPNWIWILGYTVFGLATGLAYWALGHQKAEAPARHMTGTAAAARS
ncbi:MAG: hypothetical protein C4306_08145 [Thermoleophilia bacterium]